MPRITRTTVGSVRVRFDREERAAFNLADLAGDRKLKAGAPSLAAELARIDGQPGSNRDGWVSEPEFGRASNLGANTPFQFMNLVHEARTKASKLTSVAALRKRNQPLPPLPRPLGQSVDALGAKPRDAFVPLAEYLAAAFARAKSYAPSQPQRRGDRVYYLPADDLFRGRKLEEVAAACAILTARENKEIAHSVDEQGNRFLVLGQAGEVELVKDITGLNSVFHTHNFTGLAMGRPSQNDNLSALGSDPDHRGMVATEDGFLITYTGNPNGPATQGEPRRLWQLTF